MADSCFVSQNRQLGISWKLHRMLDIGPWLILSYPHEPAALREAPPTPPPDGGRQRRERYLPAGRCLQQHRAALPGIGRPSLLGAPRQGRARREGPARRV